METTEKLNLTILGEILAQKMGVEVRIGRWFRTNGKWIELPPLSGSEEDLTLMRGGLAHEAIGHIRFSDFSDRFHDRLRTVRPMVKSVHLALEDVRIEYKASQVFAGAKNHLNEMVRIAEKKGWFSPDFDNPEKVIVFSLLRHLRSRMLAQDLDPTVVEKYVNQAKSLIGETAWRSVVDAAETVIDLEREDDVLSLAEKIVEMLMAQPDEQPQGDDTQGQQQPQDSDAEGQPEPQGDDAEGQPEPQGDDAEGQPQPQGDDDQSQPQPQGDDAQCQPQPQGDDDQGQPEPQGDDTQGQQQPQGSDAQGQPEPQGDDAEGQPEPQGDDAQGQQQPQGDDAQGQQQPQGDDAQCQPEPQGDDAQGQPQPQGDDAQCQPEPQGDDAQGQQPHYRPNLDAEIDPSIDGFLQDALRDCKDWSIAKVQRYEQIIRKTERQRNPALMSTANKLSHQLAEILRVNIEDEEDSITDRGNFSIDLAVEARTGDKYVFVDEGVPALGLDTAIMLLVDASSSTSSLSETIETATWAIGSAISKYEPFGIKLGISWFHNGYEPAKLFTDSWRRVKHFSHLASGCTEWPGSASEAILDLEKTKSKRKILLTITDGDLGNSNPTIASAKKAGIELAFLGIGMNAEAFPETGFPVATVSADAQPMVLQKAILDSVRRALKA